MAQRPGTFTHVTVIGTEEAGIVSYRIASRSAKMENWSFQHLFKSSEDRTWQLSLVIPGSRSYKEEYQLHTHTYTHCWRSEDKVSNSGNMAPDQRHSTSQSDSSGRSCGLWHPQLILLSKISKQCRQSTVVVCCPRVFLVPAFGSLK